MVGQLAIRAPAVGLKGITTVEARDAGNVLRVIKEGWIRSPTGLKQFFANLAVTLSKYNLLVRGNSAGAIQLNSPTVTATVVGGAAPYAHVWSKTAGAAGWVINGGNTDTASFTSPALGPGDSESATFIDTVTDASGQVVASAALTVDAHNAYFGGGGGGGGGPYP